MREILFRGKRMDDGGWSTGDLLQCQSGGTMIQSYVDGYRVVDVVDQSTIGQYTGLNDKHGKRIFEGDMIKPFDDEVDKMVVEFHHGQFLLCLYGERGYMAEYGWEEEGNYGCFEAEPLSSYGDDIEVIGNIHDNQELLKGGEGL